MITPFSDDGSVNVAALRQFVDWQIAEGIHGLIPLGSTGEFLSLSDAEKELVSATVIEQAAGACPGLSAPAPRIRERWCGSVAGPNRRAPTA